MNMVSEDQYNREVEYIFNRFPSFQKVGSSAYKPGIESIREFCARLGNPQQRFRSIHIAGTNGKGSTSHMLASVLSASGQKIGLFTSPHLVDFRERIKVSKESFEMVPREFVYDFIVSNKSSFEELNVSFFEITTAMSFAWFAQAGVDVAVIECGLGGRLDSTNIITPELSIITNIGLDHCNLLGNTKEAIAGEKAGIIKPGVPVVIGEESGVGEIFREKAALTESEIFFADSVMLGGADGANNANRANDASNAVGVNNANGASDANDSNGDACWVSEKEFESLLASMDLGGACQRKNLKTVLCALTVMGMPVDNSVKTAIANAAAVTGLHGRWEILSRSPFIVCDTGHNAHGFAVLGKQIMESFGNLKEERSGEENCIPRLFMMFGVMADKDLDSIVDFLPKGEARYLFVAPKTPRAMAAAKLCEKMTALGFSGEVVGDGSVAGTLEWYRGQSRESDFVFIGGSTFVVADALVASGK